MRHTIGWQIKVDEVIAMKRAVYFLQEAALSGFLPATCKPLVVGCDPALRLLLVVEACSLRNSSMEPKPFVPRVQRLHTQLELSLIASATSREAVRVLIPHLPLLSVLILCRQCCVLTTARIPLKLINSLRFPFFIPAFSGMCVFAHS